MAHEIEQLADGTAAFATARVPAWHRLGYVADQPMTASELMDKAQLGGWNVRKSLGIAAVVPSGRCLECNRATGANHTRKCTVPTEEGRATTNLVVIDEDTATIIDHPGWYSLLRTVPVSGEVQPLGIVSADYPIYQPEQLAELMQAVTDMSGGVFETGGALRDGRDIFMTLKLPESIKVGGTDEVDLYLAGMNNYSGQAKLRLITTPVRVVCANTERAALANTRSSYTFRHAKHMEARLEEVREALKITFEWTEAFKIEAEAMIDTKMTNDQFGELIKAVWPDRFVEPVAEWRSPQTTQWEALEGLFRSADTQENIRNTAWAGYQSIVEYLDWQIPVTGTEDHAEIDRIRAARSVAGHYDTLKVNSFQHCKNLVAAK